MFSKVNKHVTGIDMLSVSCMRLTVNMPSSAGQKDVLRLAAATFADRFGSRIE